MKIKAAIILSLLGLLIALPIWLKSGVDGGIDRELRRLTVITPHNETIRREFGREFLKWWEARTGERVYVNWLTPGGTSEIQKVLDSAFEAAGEDGREGVGIDVFFGGGDYEFRAQAGEMSDERASRFLKLEIFETHPEYFAGGGIEQEVRGESYYGENLDWVGVCLSSFGICYNVDGYRRLGLTAPQTWRDLALPELAGQVALADPTKSGSVNKAFEMMLQKEIQDQLEQATALGLTEAEAIELGWARGVNLIRRIGANARYFTDSATKIPRDVADGDAVVGLSIDYYGRTFNELLRDAGGQSRLQFVAPAGATSWSVDPVAVMRGAAQPDLAQGFVEFLLSWQGQRLWNVRAGADGGPMERSLRRLPVRPDLYRDEGGTRDFIDRIDPYGSEQSFVYRYELTGPAFTPLRVLVRAMCIEPHDELKAAWEALAKAGFPPQATAEFDRLDGLGYREVLDELKPRLRQSRLESVRAASEISNRFREQYRRTKQLAEAGK